MAESGNNRRQSIEHIIMFERTNENVHFGHKSAEPRQSQGRKPGNNVNGRYKWNYFKQSAQFCHIPSVCPSIDHTYKGKEKSGHESMGK